MTYCRSSKKNSFRWPARFLCHQAFSSNSVANWHTLHDKGSFWDNNWYLLWIYELAVGNYNGTINTTINRIITWLSYLFYASHFYFKKTRKQKNIFVLKEWSYLSHCKDLCLSNDMPMKAQIRTVLKNLNIFDQLHADTSSNFHPLTFFLSLEFSYQHNTYII